MSSLWPTPTAQDASNNGGKSQHKRNSKPLNAAINGRLNPAWVAWVMGFPLDWLDLDGYQNPELEGLPKEYLTE